MAKYLIALVVTAGLFMAVGCADNETGNVEAAKAAAAKAPKSVEELPKDMPENAKQAAASAMGQAEAMKAQGNDPARVRAMQEMQKQHPGGG